MEPNDQPRQPVQPEKPENPESSNSKRGLIIVIIVVVLLLAGAAVYALQNSQTEPEPTETTDTTQIEPTTNPDEVDQETEGDTAPADKLTIAFTNNGFEPDDVTVKRGTIITITNKSSKAVQFSSDEHPTHRENTEMNMQPLSPGESETYTATTSGSWGFHDHLDESKTGTITVTE